MGKLILVTAFLLVICCASRAAEDGCSLGCKGTAQPSFVNGHKYTYNVEGLVTIYLTSADKQETSVKLNGAVTVTALGNCAHVLRVNSLHINGNKYGNIPGIEKPVRFTLQDGAIGPHICSEEGDNQRSLNIKRAIISLLQNSHKHNTEVDVFGVCPTEQSNSREGGSTLVHRTRDLNRCAHREHGKHDLITAIYNPTSEIKSTHLLQSNLNVESKVKAGIPEKISATEEYLYRPFSAGQNGARARVITKMTLTGQAEGTDQGTFKVPKSIIFENPHPTNVGQNNVANLLLALKSTAQALSNDAGPKSASIFAGLIKIFRTTSRDDLMSVYKQIKSGGAVKDNHLAMRIFLDALLRTGTGDSIEVSLELLQGKELNEFEEKLTFLSLGNARHVSNEALEAAAKLINNGKTPREVYLGVGALAGSYCREHGCHGDKSQSSGIAAVSQKFVSALGKCKTHTKAEEDNVIAVLKGIRNIRHIESTLVDSLVHCVQDKDIKNRVKVAALEAIHADPCTPKLKKLAIDTMKNRQLDSEIRIKAYMALLDCPCSKVANEVKSLLETETVQQVGRYITSSLRFIRASANPDRALAKHHLGNIRAPHKFSVDDRKFSFYREVSYNVDSLGSGAVAETSVIYSQDSFLPRSASLNLTTEIFGHSINVIEIGGRQGNLDRVVEHYLGPQGVLKTHSAQDMYDYLVEKFTELKDQVGTHYRTKRAVQKEIANFAKQVKAESSSFHDELDLDIYVKLFGTDSIFLSLGDDKGFDPKNIIDQIFRHLDAGIEKAKHATNDIRSHALFLDAELSYPTSIGIPLKLNLVGAATSRIQYTFNADIRQIIKDPANAKFDFQLIPSVNIEIAATMLADADFVTTGLKVASNLYTSTGNHFIAKLLENGKGIDVQLALPLDKQELITVSNEIVFTTAEKGQQESEKALTFDVDRKQYKGCFDQLAGTIGLTFCGEFNVPWANSGADSKGSVQRFVAKYPLTGPSKVSAHLEKDDLRGYHFKAIVHNDDPAKKSFEIVLDVEGSKTNRKTLLSGDMINTAEEKTLKLVLQSPIKNVDGQISLFTKSNDYSAVVKAHHEQDEYYGRVGFAVSGNGQKSIFKPVIEYQTPGGAGKKNLNVEGQIVRESQAPPKGGYKYTLDGVKVNLPSKEVVALDGYVANEPQGFSGKIKAVKGEQSMTGSVLFDGNKLSAEMENTLNPDVNFHIDLARVRQEGQYSTNLVLVYGKDLKSQVYRLTATQSMKYQYKSAQDFNMITKNKIVFPLYQLNAKFDGEFDPKKVDIDFEGKYAGNKAKFDLEARSHIKTAQDYSIKLDAELNNKGFEVFSKRELITEDKSNFENTLTIKPGGKYELSGVVDHRFKEKDYNVGIVGHLKLDGKADDYKLDVSAIGKHPAYNSHAKISVGATVYVDYNMKLTVGATTTGQTTLILKDTIAVNGQLKHTRSDGKGHALYVVDFKKLGRKIKFESNFVAKDSTCNADADLFFDFEKDNDNKIHFETKTTGNAEKFDSKNSLLVNKQKYDVSLKRESTGTWINGKHMVDFELGLPTDRKVNFKLDRTMTEKDKTYNGLYNLAVSSTNKGGQPASFVYKAKAINTNIEKNNIDYEGLIEINLENGKKLVNAFVVKNNKEGDLEKFEYKTDLTGTLIPKPASLSVTGDVKLEENYNSEGKYRVKGNYGSDYNFDFSQDEVIHVAKNSDKKYSDNFVLTVKLPFEKTHDLKLTSNVLFVFPENQDTMFDFTLSHAFHLNADTYKCDANGKIGKLDGFTKIKVLVPKIDPISLDTNYKFNLEGEKKTGEVGMKSTYANGKSAELKFLGERLNAQEHRFLFNSDVPHFEQLKKLEVDVKTKYVTGKALSSMLTVDADGKVAKLEMSGDLSRTTPLIDLHYTSPNGKASRIYGKANIISDHHIKAEAKIENIRDYTGHMNVDAHVSDENFNIKLEADAPKLDVNKFHLDISNKDAKNGKQVDFHAKSAGKNILSGSTSYLSKQEGNKVIVEGTGSVKIHDQAKTATFKYIRDIVDYNNEQGLEVFLNVALGERSYVFEQRATNLEYKISNVFCEEKKQCANVELISKFTQMTPGQYQHTLNMGLDLRKLGFSPEFGLEMTSEVSTSMLPQYLLDVHLNQEQNKYHLHVYSQPKKGVYPSGITLTLPKRVIALESSLTYPEGKVFPIKGDVAFYLNKNAAPNKKAGLRLLLDLNEHFNGVAELGFSHPAVEKETVLSLKNVIEAKYNEPRSFKLEAVASVSNPAWGKERQTKALIDIKEKYVKVLVRCPNIDYIDFEATGDYKDAEHVAKLDVKSVIFSGKPVDTHFYFKLFEKFEFSNGYRDETDSKLSIVGDMVPENVGLRADIILKNEKKNLFHGSLFLKDNLVKSDYGASKENIKYFATAFKTDLEHLAERLRKLAQENLAHIKQDLEKSRQSFEKLYDAYKGDLVQLRDELVNDNLLEKASELYAIIVKTFAKVADEILSHVNEIVKRIQQESSDFYSKVNDLIEKNVRPELKELFEQIGEFVKSVWENLIDIVAHFAALVEDFFEKHKAELQELTNSVGEIFKDVTRIFVTRMKELRQQLTSKLDEMIQEIKKSPVFEMLQKNMGDFQVPEPVFVLLRDMADGIEKFIPATDKLVEAIYNYVNKKLRQEKVNDAEELRVIFSERLPETVTTWFKMLNSEVKGFDMPHLLSLPLLTSSFSGMSGLPFGTLPAFGSVSFSPFNYLINFDYPSLEDLIKAYRVRDFNPLNEIPAKLIGSVVNGQHIFTFDGRHMTFPGTCKYVLAHDAIDGNFTIVMQLNNGQPKSLSLVNKNGDAIDVKDDGKVLLNGAAHGVPVHGTNMYAWKESNGIIGMYTKYGALIRCTPGLRVCLFDISGFYLGKLRGLLGDGNNEQFDDFRLPNGKIVASEADFGNAYRLTSSCPAAKTPDHGHEQHHKEASPHCSMFHSLTSPLRVAFKIVDVEPFKMACSHAVETSKNPEQEACDLARAYVAICASTGVNVFMPEECLAEQCETKVYNEKYEVQLPGKKADIILAVETTVGNEATYKELVVPLMSHIIDDLKAKKIDDIKVYLYGISAKFPWPIYHDIETPKLKGAKMTFTDESRYNSLFEPIKTSYAKLNELQEQIASITSKLQIEFGVTNMVAAYQNIGMGNYRADAVRTTITVASETCKISMLPFQWINSALHAGSVKAEGYTNHMITVTPDIKVDGKPADHVVAFSKDHTVFLGEKKESDVHAKLDITKDACINFALITDGSVISASNFEKTAPAQRKAFINQASKVVSEKMVHTNVKLSCRCVRLPPFGLMWALQSEVKSICYPV